MKKLPQKTPEQPDETIIETTREQISDATSTIEVRTNSFEHLKQAVAHYIMHLDHSQSHVVSVHYPLPCCKSYDRKRVYNKHGKAHVGIRKIGDVYQGVHLEDCGETWPLFHESELSRLYAYVEEKNQQEANDAKKHFLEVLAQQILLSKVETEYWKWKDRVINLEMSFASCCRTYGNIRVYRDKRRVVHLKCGAVICEFSEKEVEIAVSQTEPLTGAGVGYTATSCGF